MCKNRDSVERPETCRGCEFFKPDRGVFYANNWSRDGSSGHCLYDPVPAPRNADDAACRYGIQKKPF